MLFIKKKTIKKKKRKSDNRFYKNNLLQNLIGTMEQNEDINSNIRGLKGDYYLLKLLIII